MKLLLVIFIALLTQPSVLLGQDKDGLLRVEGKLLNYQGELIRGLATIQVLDKENKAIRATRTDLDGYFSFLICPNQIIQDTLNLKVATIGNEIEVIKQKYPSRDFIIKLSKPNPSMDKQAYQVIDMDMLIEFECGTTYWEDSEFFMNCTGEVKSGKELRKLNANKSAWTPIKK